MSSNSSQRLKSWAFLLILRKNNVPREGIVVRKDNDIVKEAFKLKCMKFRFKEAESIDNGEVDAEMEQAYC